MNLGGVRPDFLSCREFGHAWADNGHEGIVRRGQTVIEFTRLAVCVRCLCERRQKVSVPDFRVVSTGRTYPDGYLLHGERASKGDVRREVLHRYLNRA